MLPSDPYHWNAPPDYGLRQIQIADVEAFEAIASTLLPLAVWPNPDQALRRAFSRAKDRYLVQLESRRWRQPSLARHCSLPARHAA